jgi:DNA integrity scanning protein DisA with diadenylate cyclase activity
VCAISIEGAGQQAWGKAKTDDPIWIQRSMMLDGSGETDLLGDICTPERGINLETLRHVVTLAVEIAREGREGRKVGTMFVVSDADRVLALSKCLILDPVWHHPPERKRISEDNLRETAKELAQLDGAFVISDSRILLSAARYINASSQGIDLPLGLGSRHMAAASITKETNAVAVVVSETSVVRVFDDGEMVAEIIPELWLLRRHYLMQKERQVATDKGEKKR